MPSLRSHEHIREMEHEFFQSKLKASVDGASLPGIIRSTSSGENSHRAAAMELVFERSIRERRERVSTKAKDSLQPDPTLQLDRSKPLKTPIPPVKPPVPALASPPPLQSSSDASTNVLAKPASPSTTHEVSPDSPSIFSKPAKKAKKAAREEPPADAKVNSSASGDIVRLACSCRGADKLRRHARTSVRCNYCPGSLVGMKCISCGTVKVRDGNSACSDCRRKFEE
jgi:hypothetical protein